MPEDNKDTSTTTQDTSGDEGKKEEETTKATKAKMVPESDLLAVKASREGLQTQLDELKGTHRTTVSELGVKLAAAEAKAEENAGSATKLTTAEEELKTAKEQLEAAQTSGEGHRTKALEYRRNLISTGFNIPADTIKDKTMEQLDSFEEALKAIGGVKSSGGYAIGGGAGATPVLENPLDRARRLIEEQEAKQGIARVKEKEKVAP